MTYMDMLERRSEILKRSIGRMVIKDNRQPLNLQESNYYQSMIKKWHQTENEMNSVKKQS
ncbi:hypothetical protein BK133_28770 [Paenibacillus sp. FSL H8-0548]|uniref:hypothetical protein n=1 Tax=Paenibacillus sp. FSL H8-0548 TaxID=1920422 RepID=UPI00096E98AC|nr:hypothetical protein [Paenibacillus sp. FSL H8-0548]OMF21173.1 hypothetical protein BK133_28770 [Paenibacillus sp. FSL H8-0548]